MNPSMTNDTAAPALPSVREVLIAAREVLQERGWTKEIAEDERGCVCVLGAIERVVGIGEPFETAERALRGVLDRRHWFSVVAFNDAPTTTEADIYALFDRAIAAEEAQP